jgi:hypothetical protein
MATFTAQRFLIFSGTREGISFDEFVTNFRIATKTADMTEDEKASTFFSHFDGKALTYLHQHPDILEKPLEDAIKTLRRHFVGDKPINPAKIGEMVQAPNETVRDYLQRMQVALAPINAKNEPTAEMTPDQKLIFVAQKEAQQQQMQLFIKPYFMSGIKPELKQHLGNVYHMNLKEMAKELSRFEAFQKEYPTARRTPYGVAMVDCKEPDTPDRNKENEVDQNDLNEKLEAWWAAKNKSKELTSRARRQQTEEENVHRQFSKPIKKRIQFERNNTTSNIHQITTAAPGVPAIPSSNGYTPEAMQKAAEILSNLNSAQPTVGLLPAAPPVYNMQPFSNNQPYQQAHNNNWGPAAGWGYQNQNPNPYNNSRQPFNRNAGGRMQQSNNNQQNWRSNDEPQYCSYCKKNVGHTRQYCRKRMKDEYETQRRQLEMADMNSNRNNNNGFHNNNFLKREYQERLPATDTRKAIESAPTTDQRTARKDYKENNTGKQRYQQNQSKNGERRPPQQR